MAKQGWTETWQEMSPQEKRERITASIEQAIAEGRHGPIENFRCVCEACRQWVNGIFHITFTGQRICRDCAKQQGVKDA